jgi:hypothetical protein
MNNAIDPTRGSSIGRTDDPDLAPPGQGFANDRTARDAEAFTRYQNFATDWVGQSSGNTAACGGFDARPTERIRNSTLAFAQRDDSFAFAPTDIHQRRLGDCSLMGTLAGLAATPAGRALLHDAITENRDNSGAVISYTVTLYKPDDTRFPRVFLACKVEVVPEFPRGAHADPATDQSKTKNEIWPLVIEKAYAEVRGGYDQIGCGGTVYGAMTALTGTFPQHREPGWLFGYTSKDLLRDLAAGKTIVLSTPKEDKLAASRARFPTESSNIAKEHAYAVLGTTTTEGANVMVRLYNPWGEQFSIPLNHLSKWFCEVDVSR